MTLAEQIARIVADAVTRVLKDAEPELTDIAKAGGDAAAGGLLGDVDRLTSIISSLLGDIPIIGQLIKDLGDPVDVVEHAAGRFGRGYGMGYLLGYLGWQLLGPVMLPVIHEVNANTTNQIYDPQTAAQLVARGIISPDQGRSESSGGGLDVPHFNALADSQKIWPQLTDLLELRRRDLITDDDVNVALTRGGTPEPWLAALRDLTRRLLSPADLALAFLRTDIDESTLRGYQAQLGVSDADMDVLIGNTGEPPAAQELLFAYRRGFIDKDRLERGIRQSRIRNEWLDVVEKLRYQPMSTADAIDAAVQGHLTHEQSQAKTQQDGLEPDDWQVLYETAGEPIARGEALQLMNRGEMTQAQVEQAIRESHVKDKYIPFILDLRRRMADYFALKPIATTGSRDHAWLVNYLMDLGYVHDDADALASSWTTQKTATAKALTEAQVLDLYKGQQIDEQTATSMLGKLGYSAAEAALLERVQDAQRAAAEQTKAITATRTLYLAHRASRPQASSELDRLGVPAAARDTLLHDWDVERAGVVRTLTASEVRDAFKYGILSPDAAGKRLEQLGYSQDDARILLEITAKGPFTTPGTGLPSLNTA